MALVRALALASALRATRASGRSSFARSLEAQAACDVRSTEDVLEVAFALSTSTAGERRDVVARLVAYAST